MASYEIVSTDYAKENDAFIKDKENHFVKTVLMVIFVKDDGSKSHEQRYEVDGDDMDFVNEELQKTADEYNTRIVI